jgi:hypothetical protein
LDRSGRNGGARSEVSGGVRGEAVGAADAAQSGRHLSPRTCVRIVPPMAGNQGSARRDVATDRRAHASVEFRI